MNSDSYYSGFFISSNRNCENKALIEFNNIVTELQPIKTNSIVDFEKVLQLDKKVKSPFIRHNFKKLKNIILVKTQTANVLQIFKALKDFDIGTKYINRLVPLEYISKIDETNYLIQLCLKDRIYNENETFKIEYRSRMCVDVKDRIFEIILKNVKMNVSLDKPDWIFVVEAMIDLVGFSFLRNTSFNLKINKN